jgi:hypothetical protein
MKRDFILSSLITFLLNFATWSEISAQYHPMPAGEARWDITRCWYFYPGGWHDRYFIEMDGTDTVLNGKVYKKLFHTTHHAPGTEFDSIYTHFLGGMREAGKQVFMWSEYLCLDTIERMIYDFNDVGVGDTIFTQVLTNGLTLVVPHIVTSVDEVYVDGSLRRRINLRDENFYFNESWIEGIGSSMGLVYATYWLLTDNSYDLNCAYEDGHLEYVNPNPAYAFCTPPFPESECDSVVSVPRPVPDPPFVRLIPNPVLTTLYLEASPGIQTIEIYDLVGTRWTKMAMTPQVDVSYLPAGMYILRFSTDSANEGLIESVIKL